MKKSDIKVGHTYTNGSSVRLVIGEGSQYAWSRQEDWDCVRYRITEHKTRPREVGDEWNCTRRSFASWAKEIAPEQAEEQ